MPARSHAYKNPVPTFRRAMLDFPAQLVLTVLWGGAISAILILVLQHAPTVVAFARDLASA
jgi:hypothetical protein